MPPAPQLLKRLGERVRTLRLAKKWSQEEFADRCNIDRSYMSGIERGKRNISIVQLSRIAKALGVHSSALLDF